VPRRRISEKPLAEVALKDTRIHQRQHQIGRQDVGQLFRRNILFCRRDMPTGLEPTPPSIESVILHLERSALEEVTQQQPPLHSVGAVEAGKSYRKVSEVTKSAIELIEGLDSENWSLRLWIGWKVSTEWCHDGPTPRPLRRPGIQKVQHDSDW
jgi:hypothetical protein